MFRSPASRPPRNRDLAFRSAPRIGIALLASALLAWAGSGCGWPSASPRLLLLISVDTLRADYLGAYGNDLGLTPNLDALAAQSQTFHSAYAPSAFTLPSVSALMTGRYPEELGIRSNRSALRTSIPTLAGSLREQGWATRAVVSNFVLRRNSGLASGFESYDDELPQQEVVRGWPERTADATSDAAIRALEALAGDSRNALLWVHYQDPHGPYTPPAALRDRYLAIERERPDGGRQLPRETGRGGRGRLPSYQEVDGQREVAFYRAGYAAEIAYLDGEIGRLLDALDESGLGDASIVAFTADHGESLGENDYWFAHGERLSDPLVRVPLLIRSPSLEPRRRDDVASLVDLFPTLIRLAIGSAARPSDAGLPGRDLLAPDSQDRSSTAYLATLGGATQQRFGIVDGRYKLVVSRAQGRSARERPGPWRSQLYRRDDAGVEHPADESEVASRLRVRLDAFRASLPRGETELRQTLSDTERDQLRALGYAEPSRGDR